MELYIHIPFCVKKCNYCDFLSFPGYGCDADEGHRSLSYAYVDALCRELDEIKKSIGNRAAEIQNSEGKKASFSDTVIDSVRYILKNQNRVSIDTCFIGGGTPSVLEIEETEKLLKKISEVICFSWKPEKINADASLDEYFQKIDSSEIEFTIECNPGTLNREKLQLYKKYGVNRLSIGLQSADNDILSALGRIHTYEEFLENYKLARKFGFNNINIDLISAVPGQTIENWEHTLRKVTALKPEHISAYSLIIEEGTRFFEKFENNPEELCLPNEETEREIYHLTKKILQENGYYRYEISNYSLDGFECRHNIGYWTGKEYIGAGLGASSYLSIGNAAAIKDLSQGIKIEEAVRMLRLKNTNDLHEYISNSSFEIEEQLTQEDLMTEYCILGLRMCKGISVADFKNLFGIEIKERFGDIINKFVKNGLLKEKEERISFTEKGMDLSNIVLCEFI